MESDKIESDISWSFFSAITGVLFITGLEVGMVEKEILLSFPGETEEVFRTEEVSENVGVCWVKDSPSGEGEVSKKEGVFWI